MEGANDFEAPAEELSIDVVTLQRTKRALGARTETETIHRALDLVANEAALAKACASW